MMIKHLIGQHTEKLLFNRLPKDSEGRPQHDLSKLSDDEIIMLDAWNDIRSLRKRDPREVEAERIIRAAATSLR